MPAVAIADWRESYTLLGLEPVIARYSDPLAGSRGATVLAGGLEIVGYHGISNTLHLGGTFHLARVRDVSFGTVSVTQDGSSTTGSVYADDLVLGLSALALYRFDTGLAIAPVLTGEMGVNHHSYSNIVSYRSGTYPVTFASVSEFRAAIRGGAFLEYRFRARYVAALGVTVATEPGGHARWLIGMPLRVGAIW